MKLKLIPFYESILSAIGMRVTEDGFVKATVMGETRQMTIGGKSLVLPTRDQLTSSDWENKITFHPIPERLMRAESEVMTMYRESAVIHLRRVISVLMLELLGIAASTALHSSLSPAQAEFLTSVPDADEKTQANLAKIIAAMPSKQIKQAPIGIFLKKGGKVGGRNYQRAAIVNFPLYQELKATKDHSVYGVTIRVKDVATLISLMEYIFPLIGTPEAYNRGSDSTAAPNLDAVLKAIIALGTDINDKVSLFADKIEDSADLVINDDWVETEEEIDKLLSEARAIPPQAGNEGAPAKTELAQQQTAPEMSPPVYIPPGHNTPLSHPPIFPAPPPPTFQAPTQQQSPTAANNGKTDFAATLRQQAYPQFAQFQPQPSPFQQPQQFQQPGFGFQQPVNNGPTRGRL